MKYFTAEEAIHIVRKMPIQLACCFEGNPNREAIRAVTEEAGNWRNPTVYLGVVYGFQLGLATGIRAERAKRRGRHG